MSYWSKRCRKCLGYGYCWLWHPKRKVRCLRCNGSDSA